MDILCAVQSKAMNFLPVYFNLILLDKLFYTLRYGRPSMVNFIIDVYACWEIFFSIMWRKEEGRDNKVKKRAEGKKRKKKKQVKRSLYARRDVLICCVPWQPKWNRIIPPKKKTEQVRGRGTDGRAAMKPWFTRTKIGSKSKGSGTKSVITAL